MGMWGVEGGGVWGVERMELTCSFSPFLNSSIWVPNWSSSLSSSASRPVNSSMPSLHDCVCVCVWGGGGKCMCGWGMWG